MSVQVRNNYRSAEQISLLRKLRYFFDTQRRGRGEVANFLAHLSATSRLAVVGGMVRDLHLEGNERFTSDIDLVAYDCSPQVFSRRMRSLGGTPNRFGGFKIPLNQWAIEVWHLEHTWARSAQVADVQSIADLLRTTFFDWDAILYDLRTREIISEPYYFERIRARVLDIRLTENPNPFGNAVRALRYAARWQATFTPRLAEHVLREVRNRGWREAVCYDSKFSKSYLATYDGHRVIHELREAVRYGSHAFVMGPHTSRQKRFGLDHEGQQLSLPLIDQIQGNRPPSRKKTYLRGARMGTSPASPYSSPFEP